MSVELIDDWAGHDTPLLCFQIDSTSRATDGPKAHAAAMWSFSSDSTIFTSELRSQLSYYDQVVQHWVPVIRDGITLELYFEVLASDPRVCVCVYVQLTVAVGRSAKPNGRNTQPPDADDVRNIGRLRGRAAADGGELRGSAVVAGSGHVDLAAELSDSRAHTAKHHE
jgi:hypothetical protein